MKIIIKFILKSIKDNKFRTFLIIFSIVLSSALFFASNAISGTIEKMYLTRIRQYFGSSDIVIRTGRNSPTRFFYINNAQLFKDKFEYIIGYVENTGTYKPGRDKKNSFYETNTVSMGGIDLDDLQIMNPFILFEEKNLYPFAGKKIILNKTTCEKFNFKIGDDIDIEINGSKQRFIIAGIAQPTGPFQDNDNNNITAVVPKDTLGSLNDARGKVSVVYIKLKNSKEKQKMIEQLSMLYTRYFVSESFNDAQLKSYTSRITTPFLMMTIIVLLLSIFIIYSSFKVITMERLPVIGTFRSIGATKRTTDFVLFIESIVYGTIGGILGCLLGIGILFVMTSIMADNPWESAKMNVQIDFNIFQILISFFMAIILSFVGSLIPILKISKIPVKDIVLNKIEKDVKTKTWKTYFGFFAIVFSIIIPIIVPQNFAMIIDIVCIIFCIISIILLVPVMTNIFVKFFEKVYIHIFGNEGVLATKNLRENKSILNNISLIAIGISTILMINTVSFSVVGEITSFYKSAKFDIWMWYWHADRTFESRMKTVEGVYDVYGEYSINSTEIIKPKKSKSNENIQEKSKSKKSDDVIRTINGIDKDKFLDYWKINLDKNLLNQLDDGRNIIMTYTLKDRFNVNKNDIIKLKINGKERMYCIIGFFNTLRNGGNFAIVSQRYLKMDANLLYYENIYIKTNKPANQVVGNIKMKFGNQRPWLETISKMEDNEIKSNAQTFTILKGFSLLTLIIGIFGVLNNFIISFIERKRHLAIFRSVGMSKKQIVKMIFVEAITGGIIGGIIGLFSGLILIFIVEYLMKKGMKIDIPMHYSFILFFYSMIASVIITVIASISPAIKSSKLNIIEAIKYE